MERIRVAPGGNILIGKTSQTNTSYLLDVNGFIRAHKLVVNSTGADFVFDKTYSLPSLHLVEKYIQDHHHLQGIQPASQMQAEGTDLGETQTQLLQKVEELTLYVIQLNKEIESMKKQIKKPAKKNLPQNNNRHPETWKNSAGRLSKGDGLQNK